MGAIAIDPTNPKVIYAGTNAFIGEGLFRSVDGGLHWEKVCDDLKGAWITSIEVTPDGRTLYVGTEGRGVYRIDVGTSTKTSAELTSVGWMRLRSPEEGHSCAR